LILDQLRATLGSGAARQSRPPAAPSPLRLDDPLSLPQALWGLGFSSPGTPEMVVALVAGCDLRPSSLVLDLTAGLGGRARTIATAYGCYVTGLERDFGQAARGATLSQEAGLARRAAIRHYNPALLELRRESFDCAIEDGLFAGIAEKERLLRAIHHGLRRGGRLVMTELVGLQDEADLWSAEQYRDCLRGLGFQVATIEDLSAPLRSVVASGWQSFLDRVDVASLPGPHRAEILLELQSWTDLVAQLENGTVGYLKIEASVVGSHRLKPRSLDSRRSGSYFPRLARGK
jgi:SAM-dependent methyltransferase